ncbi:MAG: TAT-variant-translocated molybdopterin oxidoreductase [Flavobacteriales bacterium]
MSSNKKYWKGHEEAERPEEFLEPHRHEFPEELPVQEYLADEKVGRAVTNRRDFLKFLGFSLSAAALASCETPVNKVVPYIDKPEGITPGVPDWYASTYFDGHDFANVLVKTREGRPIFLKGNEHFGLNQGATNARVNASVLSLYDSERLQGPIAKGKERDWSLIDGTVEKELSNIAEKGGTIRLLTSSIMSPSTKAVIEEFRKKYGKKTGSGNREQASMAASDTTRTDTSSTEQAASGSSEEQGPGADLAHIVYDDISFHGILKANERCFGKAAIPSYDLSKAGTIVSVAADFLANWVAPNLFSPQYGKERDPDKGSMLRHYQFESNLSLSGSNADIRVPIKASEEALVVASIHDHIANMAGKSGSGLDTASMDKKAKKAAEELWKRKQEGKGSLLICGTNDPDVQALVNAVNQMLENYGTTIDLNNHLNLRQGDDEAVEELLKEMENGQVDALLMHGVNPAYSHPASDRFVKALDKTELSLSFSQYKDETAKHCDFICPDHHFLESWNDHEPQRGYYTLSQPAIRNLYNTRQFQDSLLTWAGFDKDFHAFIQDNWKQDQFQKQGSYNSFHDFWGNSLHKGGFVKGSAEAGAPEFKGDLQKAASGIRSSLPSSKEGMELVLYQKVGMGNGQHANNPWLQELPDPISRVTWDNYVTMNPEDMDAMKFTKVIGQEWPADTAKVSVGKKSLELPVYPQPGQKKGTIGIALGYGRGANGEAIGNAAFQCDEFGQHKTDQEGNPIPVGKNAFPFLSFRNGALDYRAFGVKIEKTGNSYPIATTQTHHTIMGRESILKETTLETFNKGSKSDYNPDHTLKVHEDGEQVEKEAEKIDLWREHPVESKGHRWGLSIDLSTCIGCGACVVACSAENNVPVVGKDEVRRTREMHWLRIDRYYSSKVEDRIDEEYEELSHKQMDTPEAETPDVTFQPMMCQHCNHAPCETVCPVAATTHSNEGLNMMAYNRCIGTRYCANNCPYKVRRFNWFNYRRYKKFENSNPAQGDMSRMVLNPDVTVRSRGVMEKCSLCVQRIQSGKLEAKKEGHPVEDGAIQTACAEACPTNAIAFGDINDDESRVHKEHMKSKRAYYALEEIGTEPNVAYQVKVRNRQEKEEKSGQKEHS